MIRRRDERGLLLIRQVEHAALSAKLAAAVGNERFASPLPRGEVLRAVELHDAGWPMHDDAPTLNQRAQPTDAFEMPLDLSLRIWSASTEVATAANPYTGLLVSLHGLGLSQRAHPEPIQSRTDAFALIKFQHAQIEIQETLRRQLGMNIDIPLRDGMAETGGREEEDLLRHNFHLLEFADQLSLNLCFDQGRFPNLSLIAHAGEAATQLTVWRRQAGCFVLDPWPLAGQDLQVTAMAVRLPDRKFADEQELRAALAAAERVPLSMTVQRGRR
jgi:hypothetical protein